MSIFGKLGGLFKSTPKDSEKKGGHDLDNLSKFSGFVGNDKLGEWFSKRMMMPRTRMERWELYNDMDVDLVASVLDVYAEDATQFNLKENATVWIETSNSEVKNVLDALLKRLMVEDYLYSIARDVAKHGEEFDELILDEDHIFSWEPKQGMVYKVMDKDTGRLLGYSFDGENDKAYSLPWDFVHFKLIGKARDRKYGTSMLEPLIRVTTRLNMMEDAAAVYRILKHPDRTHLYVDCTGLTAPQASERIKSMEHIINKQIFVDSNNQQLKKEFSAPGSATGIVIVPVIQGREDRIEEVSANSRVQDVYDLEYFLRRFCSVCRIPPEYLGLDFSTGIRFESNQSLVQQDVKYSRMIKKLQRSALRGIVATCEIELCLHNIDPRKKDNAFKVCGDPISFLDEMQRADLYDARLRIIDSFTRLSRDLSLEGPKWTEYLLVTFGGFTNEMLDILFSSEEDGEESTAASKPITADMKRDLTKEYENNTGLQKSVEEIKERVESIVKDIEYVADSKYSNGYLQDSVVEDIGKWKGDIETMKLEKVVASKKGDKEEVLRLNEEIHRYMSKPYKQITEGID